MVDFQMLPTSWMNLIIGKWISNGWYKDVHKGHASINCLVPMNIYWLVVWTPLKNISQLGWLFPIYGKIKNVPNHQPVYCAHANGTNHGLFNDENDGNILGCNQECNGDIAEILEDRKRTVYIMIFKLAFHGYTALWRNNGIYRDISPLLNWCRYGNVWVSHSENDRQRVGVPYLKLLPGNSFGCNNHKAYSI